MSGIYAICVSIVVLREDYNCEKKRHESLGFSFKVSDAYCHFRYSGNHSNEADLYYSHKEAINACQKIVEQTGIKPNEILVISNVIFGSSDFADMYSLYHYDITKAGKQLLTQEL